MGTRLASWGCIQRMWGKGRETNCAHLCSLRAPQPLNLHKDRGYRNGSVLRSRTPKPAPWLITHWGKPQSLRLCWDFLHLKSEYWYFQSHLFGLFVRPKIRWDMWTCSASWMSLAQGAMHMHILLLHEPSFLFFVWPELRLVSVFYNFLPPSVVSLYPLHPLDHTWALTSYHSVFSQWKVQRESSLHPTSHSPETCHFHRPLHRLHFSVKMFSKDPWWKTAIMFGIHVYLLQ